MITPIQSVQVVQADYVRCDDCGGKAGFFINIELDDIELYVCLSCLRRWAELVEKG